MNAQLATALCDSELILRKNFLCENSYMRKHVKKRLPMYEQKPAKNSQHTVFIHKT
jgi:hypothetical protein